VHGFLQQAGIANLQPATFYGLALSLGGVEVSMLELARLYAALANGGRLRPIRMLKEQETGASPEQILSPEASFLVLDILKDNPPPEGHRVPLSASAGNQVAWKTGTSHGFRDAWAVGVCADTVVAVWVGNFNGEGNRAFVGRTAAGPLLFDLLAALVPPQGWAVADMVNFSRLNLIPIDVCAATGELPGRHCPHTRTSWFIPGVSPIRVCTVHRAVAVDAITGMRACRRIPQRTQMAVFEFWPSDLLAIFRMAGISIKDPPPFAGDCSLDQRAAWGQTPVITSPQQELVYAMRSELPLNHQIPFSAVADGDVRQLYWFVGNRYVGASEPGRPLMWTPQSGSFDIRAVDDHGRAALTSLMVEMVQ
jgi:penicillin-binding protein 1C